MLPPKRFCYSPRSPRCPNPHPRKKSNFLAFQPTQTSSNAGFSCFTRKINSDHAEPQRAIQQHTTNNNQPPTTQQQAKRSILERFRLSGLLNLFIGTEMQNLLAWTQATRGLQDYGIRRLVDVPIHLMISATACNAGGHVMEILHI